MNVYIGQFDVFWKLTEREWFDVCSAGASGRGYDLSQYRRLKRRPRFIVRNEDRRGYWSKRQDVRYVEPLDWYPEDFTENLADIEALRSRR